MRNPVQNAKKKFIYHALISIFWADERKDEEKAMLLKAQKTQAGVEVSELEPSFLGIPLEAEFSRGPPPQLFYEVSSNAPGSPMEILISAESIVPEAKWHDPETKCDFVGNLNKTVRPADIVEAVTELAENHPTYGPPIGTDGERMDCQTFTLLMMASFLRLDYFSVEDLDDLLGAGDALDNTVEQAINNARGRPEVYTALVAAREELWTTFDDWIKENLNVKDWDARELQRLDDVCARDEFAGVRWSSSKPLLDDWEANVDVVQQQRAGELSEGLGRVTLLCRLRHKAGGTAKAGDALQEELAKARYRQGRPGGTRHYRRFDVHRDLFVRDR